MFNYSNRKMGSIVDQPCDIILWHFWKLLLENAFQAGENDEALAFSVVVDNPEFDFAFLLFNHRRL